MPLAHDDAVVLSQPESTSILYPRHVIETYISDDDCARHHLLVQYRYGTAP